MAVLLPWGCSSISPEGFETLQRLSLTISQARKDYRLQPGDMLRVVVYRGAQLPPEYQQQITIQPDGRITLVNHPTPLPAADRTIAELQSAIKDAYTPVFSRKDTPPLEAGAGKFEVTVQFVSSQKAQWLPEQVYVVGEVFRSAAVPYRQGLTVMQAVSNAGGWRPTANESRVVLMRLDAEGKTVSSEIDLASVVAHEGDDRELFPGDVVYVPRSVIAQVGIWVDQYIRALLPINPSIFTAVAASS